MLPDRSRVEVGALTGSRNAYRVKTRAFCHKGPAQETLSGRSTARKDNLTDGITPFVLITAFPNTMMAFPSAEMTVPTRTSHCSETAYSKDEATIKRREGRWNGDDVQKR